MTGSILATFILALSATTAISQTAASTPRPLVEWDLTELTQESQAACGAFMTKLGYVVAQSKKTEQVAQIMFRGIALDLLSKRTHPEINEQAWAADFDPTGSDVETLLKACVPLANSALENDMIPKEMIDSATRQTIKYMGGGS